MLADLQQILPDHRAYVEVFSGSAKLLLNKTPSQWELLNDVNGEIINFFRVVKHRPAELAELLERDIIHPERFKELRSSKNPDEIERALRFSYLAWHSFGGKQEHYAGGSLDQRAVRKPLHLVRDLLEQLAERLRNVLLESRDCVDCVKRYDRKDTLFFLDPPYLDESGGVATYNEMPIEHHRKLAAALKRIKGKFLLTYNDHPEIRAMYEASKRCVITPISRVYTLASNGNRSQGLQLIITNYDPEAVREAARKLAGIAFAFAIGLTTSAAVKL